MPEYRVVFPMEKNVIIFLLKNGRYAATGAYDEPGPIPVHSPPGFSLEWEDIFSD